MFRKLLHKGAEKLAQITAPRTTEIQYLERKISQWLGSPHRRAQINGELYYLGFHDILHRKREAIGADGKLIEVNNLPNEKIVDNLYATAVDMKNSYLLSQEPVFVTENEEFQKELDKIINADFLETLMDLGEYSLTGGVGYLYVYYDEEGYLRFRVFPAHSILPFYTNDNRKELECVVRYYEEEPKNALNDEVIKHIEIYKPNGIDNYILIGNKLFIDNKNPHTDYMVKDNKAYTWSDKIPIIPFKINNKELPLLNRCKSIQDAINKLTSDFCNNMSEDVRNTVLVLENYDGENLGEFRQNLMAYGAIKVRSESGANGDVRALRIEVDSTNYNVILSLLKQSLFQNCRAFDTANLRMDGSPNSLQMRGVYQAMDMDANMTIVKYKWALEKLFWFVKAHLKAIGKGDYIDDKIKIVFNKDMLVNEQEIMTSLTNAGVRIPNILMLEQIPWINDPKKAQEMIEEEDRKMLDSLDPYAKVGQGGKGTSSNKPKVNTNSAETRLTGGNT